jgi:hypothetical protein
MITKASFVLNLSKIDGHDFEKPSNSVLQKLRKDRHSLIGSPITQLRLNYSKKDEQ